MSHKAYFNFGQTFMDMLCHECISIKISPGILGCAWTACPKIFQNRPVSPSRDPCKQPSNLPSAHIMFDMVGIFSCCLCSKCSFGPKCLKVGRKNMKIFEVLRRQKAEWTTNRDRACVDLCYLVFVHKSGDAWTRNKIIDNRKTTVLGCNWMSLTQFDDIKAEPVRLPC